ncbi:MAG TPA: phosphoglucosamine mutase [Acidimicrobiales bacterium]|nr:phosphoglucosamine mutase [Acidimicrobiales bacterium]
MTSPTQIRFGTDGIRGRVDTDVTPAVAHALGRAAAEVLGVEQVVVGWDTRASGRDLVRAFAAGVAAGGAEARLVGVAPTPAVAFLAAATGAAGCSVTASHNDSEYNGLKFFDPRGLKLPDETEAAMAATANRHLVDGSTDPPLADLAIDASLLDAYLTHLGARLAGLDLRGLRIGLDCAHGAATAVAPALFRRLDLADLVVVGDEPDGSNINRGVGSTHMGHLATEVVARGLDVGFSFDGDADRVMAVTDAGEVLDGDQLLAVLAGDMLERGVLTDRKVVVTHWSNLGLLRALEAKGIEVVETDVGDRFVLEVLTRDGLSLGGEQSGHLILRDLSTTGDGVLAAIELLAVVVRTGRPLGELAAAAMQKMPQVTVAIPVADPREAVRALSGLAETENGRLGRDGRVVLRASGTEAVVRVMAEATTLPRAQEAVDRVAVALARGDGEKVDAP